MNENDDDKLDLTSIYSEIACIQVISIVNEILEVRF